MPIEDKNGKFHGDHTGQFVSKGKNDENQTKGYNSQDRDGNIFRNARSAAKNGKSQEEFFGEEFTGVKGSDAIEKLLKEKRGHVKNAFERPEIGGIDLVWGDDTGGLGHTIMRRNKQLAKGTGTTSGIDMARKIPEIMEKGTFSMGENGRPNITYHDFLVIVSPTFDGKKVNWVVSAMEPQKEI